LTKELVFLKGRRSVVDSRPELPDQSTKSDHPHCDREGSQSDKTLDARRVEPHTPNRCVILMDLYYEAYAHD